MKDYYLITLFQIQFNNKKNTVMKQQICIKLKPISIEFYSQKDCPINNRYSVIIQQNNTIYKSGIIKSGQVKYLQLSTLSWMEFMIGKSEADSYISIVLTNHLEDVPRLQSQNNRNSQNSSREFVEYRSMLPINQLRRIPLNKKKKFNFPFMYEGQIRAQGQFKILITQNRTNSSEDLFGQINRKQNQKTDNNKQIDNKGTPNQRKQVKSTILRAKLSDTTIIITPDLFKRKGEEMELDKETQSQILLDLDLVKKFEMLNKKFSQNDEAPDNSIRNQNESVWEDQQQNQCSQSIVNKYYNYEIIEQQKQQEQQAQY